MRTTRQAASLARQQSLVSFPTSPATNSDLERVLAELDDDASRTGLGSLKAVLTRGAGDPSEHELVENILILSAAACFPSAPEEELEVTKLLVWLEANTRLSVLAPLAQRLEEGRGAFWSSLGGVCVDANVPRGEALIAAVALSSGDSDETRPARERASLGAPPGVLCLLSGALESMSPLQMDSLEGELGPTPRSALGTVIATMTLWLFVSHAIRAIGRMVLGYRSPARLQLTDVGLVLHLHTEMLGRKLRERSTLVPYSEVAQLTRETRFARAGLYAGLGALILGTYFGAGFFVDGMRAPGGSPSLLGIAPLLMVLGLVADFALTSLTDGMRGKCSLIVSPRRGHRWALAGVEPTRADALLARVVRPPASPSPPPPGS